MVSVGVVHTADCRPQIGVQLIFPDLKLIFKFQEAYAVSLNGYLLISLQAITMFLKWIQWSKNYFRVTLPPFLPPIFTYSCWNHLSFCHCDLWGMDIIPHPPKYYFLIGAPKTLGLTMVWVVLNLFTQGFTIGLFFFLTLQKRFHLRVHENNQLVRLMVPHALKWRLMLAATMDCWQEFCDCLAL